ncbi:MAG TPA: cytochrome C biogenesis protein CcmI, partial [Thalassospira lucentensis]|nr:cytochrome C biogenesis protein CcmI [Thalassospira lucentensis]
MIWLGLLVLACMVSFVIYVSVPKTDDQPKRSLGRVGVAVVPVIG